MDRATRSNQMPETDLVTIAEREVIEAAKMVAEAHTNPFITAVTKCRLLDNLAAAVALLESRKQMKEQLKEKHADTV